MQSSIYMGSTGVTAYGRVLLNILVNIWETGYLVANRDPIYVLLIRIK